MLDLEEKDKMAQRQEKLFTSPLSAQARAGLSGNEIASAMNSLAVQRDMLRELTAINRNTKNNKTATWR